MGCRQGSGVAKAGTAPRRRPTHLERPSQLRTRLLHGRTVLQHPVVRRSILRENTFRERSIGGIAAVGGLDHGVLERRIGAP